MSDSAELKNMLSAQYNFILNTHVVNKVQLLLLWSDTRFKIKVAKQIATSGLRRCKKKNTNPDRLPVENGIQNAIRAEKANVNLWYLS